MPEHMLLSACSRQLFGPWFHVQPGHPQRPHHLRLGGRDLLYARARVGDLGAVIVLAECVSAVSTLVYHIMIDVNLVSL